MYQRSTPIHGMDIEAQNYFRQTCFMLSYHWQTPTEGSIQLYCKWSSLIKLIPKCTPTSYNIPLLQLLLSKILYFLEKKPRGVFPSGILLLGHLNEARCLFEAGISKQ